MPVLALATYSTHMRTRRRYLRGDLFGGGRPASISCATFRSCRPSIGRRFDRRLKKYRNAMIAISAPMPSVERLRIDANPEEDMITDLSFPALAKPTRPIESSSNALVELVIPQSYARCRRRSGFIALPSDDPGAGLGVQLDRVEAVVHRPRRRPLRAESRADRLGLVSHAGAVAHGAKAATLSTALATRLRSKDASYV